jgi:hypothetical protein
MIATTATRKATDTMMPSSVKNERSLFARICPMAMASTSVNRMVRKRRRVVGAALEGNSERTGLVKSFT